MTETQWLLLALVVAAVAGAYFYIRRQANDDPWQDMEADSETATDDLDRGVSLGGDSYIVGVRTIGGPMEAPKAASPPPAPTGKSRAPVESQAKGKTSPPWAAFSTKSNVPKKTGLLIF